MGPILGPILSKSGQNGILCGKWAENDKKLVDLGQNGLKMGQNGSI